MLLERYMRQGEEERKMQEIRDKAEKVEQLEHSKMTLGALLRELRRKKE
jgi:hypothetical protein